MHSSMSDIETPPASLPREAERSDALSLQGPAVPDCGPGHKKRSEIGSACRYGPTFCQWRYGAGVERPRAENDRQGLLTRGTTSEGPNLAGCGGKLGSGDRPPHASARFC